MTSFLLIFLTKEIFPIAKTFIIEGKFTSGFKSINKTSISEIQKRELLKKSSCMKKQLNRYFEVNDEDKFAYYTDKNGNKMRKQFDLNKVIF